MSPSKTKEHLETLKIIGRRVTELRLAKGYPSRLEFANDHDLAHIQYWRIEKGLANLTFKSLAKVLAIHNMTIEDLFCEMLSKKSKQKTKTGSTRARAQRLAG